MRVVRVSKKVEMYLKAKKRVSGARSMNEVLEADLGINLAYIGLKRRLKRK
tara:strand:- start:325 stop:477 length:153 start_codon:yes stop_codon:yes gene_type:complete